jgi:hypothetical protein
VPEAPINLQNVAFDIVDRSNLETTTDTQIRFTWSEGANNGGVQVIDFNVYYDQGSIVSEFVLLEAGVTTTFYQTTILITAGETY